MTDLFKEDILAPSVRLVAQSDSSSKTRRDMAIGGGLVSNPSVRLVANANAGREEAKELAFGGGQPVSGPNVRLVSFDIPAVHGALERDYGVPAGRLAHQPGSQCDNATKEGGWKGTGAPLATDAPALLVSYFYIEPFLKEKHRYRYRDWVMDSGAFSAHNSGGKIDLNKYVDTCLHLLETDPTLTEVFALDVIGDAEGSLKNTEEMWRQGVPAIPCFHAGEPEEFLLHIAKEYPKIALGGVALERGDFKFKFCEQCFARVWPKKIHGFGMSSPKLVYGLPFHSVDATNWEIAPCLEGGSMVSTAAGLVRIEELVGKRFAVNTYEQVTVEGCTAIAKGVKETTEVKLTTGLKIIATLDHKILTINGWKQAGQLQAGDRVRIPDGQLRIPAVEDCTQDELFGWMIGDGWFCDCKGRKCCGVLFADGDLEAMERLGPAWNKFVGKKTNVSSTICRSGNNTIRKMGSESKAVFQKFLDLGFKPGTALDRELPKYIFTARPAQQLAFLRGLFSADGCLGERRTAGYIAVCLGSSSRELLRQVQLLLMDFGIQANTEWRKPWMKNEQGRLTITGESSRRYMRLIGFNISKKNKGFWPGNKWTRDIKKYASVLSVTKAAKCKVYDVVMPQVHHFVANGIVVHNCAFGNWEKYGQMSVRGSNQDLRSQVKHYLEMEAKARIKWVKQMAQLETLAPSPAVLGAPTVRTPSVRCESDGRRISRALEGDGNANKQSPKPQSKPAAALTGELDDKWKRNWWE